MVYMKDFSLVALLAACMSVLPALPAVAIDADGNGVQDQDEQALIEMFCPSLVLNKDDAVGGLQVCPEPVEIVTGELYGRALSEALSFAGTVQFFPQSLDFSWILFEDYLWDSSWIPNELEPQCNQYTRYLIRHHFDYGGFGPGCAGGKWSQGNNDQPAGWREIYRSGNAWEIDVPSLGVTFEHQTLPGSEFPHTVYAHIYDPTPGGIVIQYWYFYPFNDWIDDHEGDWEHIDVRISGNSKANAQLVDVVYYFHEKYKIVSGYEFYREDSTHPVIFVGGSGNYEYLDHFGQGPGSHGSYPLRGLWHSVVDNGPLDMNDDVGGNGFYIPWRAFVDDDTTDADGVVLLKNPNFVAPSIKSWLKGDLWWGHPYVHGFWDDTPLQGWERTAPRGPYHQSTWENTGGDFGYYAASATGNTNWAAPALAQVTAPAENQPVSGVVTILGTVSYADEVLLDHGSGTSPVVWLEDGLELAHSQAPNADNLTSLNGVIGTWNTGVVPSGIHTIRVRALVGGSWTELTRTVSVTHQTFVVAYSGGNYTTIQDALDVAEMGDTIRVSGEQQYGSIVMKPTVHLISMTGGTELFGDNGQPTITISDHSYPCVIDGLVIRHNYIDPTQPGGATDHGVKITDASPVFRNCVFTGNSANRGGGASIIGDSKPLFEDCWFASNHAALEGGGVYLDGGSAAFVRTKFELNYVAAGGEGGTALSMKVPLTSVFGAPSFVDCVFQNNDSPGSSASTLRLTSYTSFIGCVFSGNGTSYLGRITGAQPHLANCTITANEIGSSLFARTDAIAGLTCTRCIISSNGGPLTTTSLAAQTIVEESILYGNSDSSVGPSDGNWTEFVEDPVFCNAALGNYHIYAFSPAAPGAHFSERVGAFDVACVPDAEVGVAPEPPNPPGVDSTLVFACPAGDGGKKLVVTIDLDDAVVTREIQGSEIVLQTPPFPGGTLRAFDEDGDGKLAASGPASGPGFVTTIEQQEFGGTGTDALTVMINGVPLVAQANVNIRTPDTANPSGPGPDGTVSVADLAAFGANYPPPKPYNYVFDFNGDGMVSSGDFAAFGSHWGHTSTHGMMTTPAAVAQSSAGVSLQFTEEYVTSTDRRLYVYLDLNGIAGVQVCVLSFRAGISALKLLSWESSGSPIGDVLFTPTMRDGAAELFFGILVSESFEGSSARLGRLVFDVETNDPLEIDDDSFQLTVGDLQMVGDNGQALAASMSSVVGRTLDPIVARVFHNRLEQNFPNPFNPNTTIAFSIKSGSNVSLTIYDVAGRRVRELVNEKRNAGAYRMDWNGRNDNGQPVASGVYFYKLVAGSFTDTKKMTILK